MFLKPRQKATQSLRQRNLMLLQMKSQDNLLPPYPVGASELKDLDEKVVIKSFWVFFYLTLIDSSICSVPHSSIPGS